MKAPERGCNLGSANNAMKSANTGLCRLAFVYCKSLKQKGNN